MLVFKLYYITHTIIDCNKIMPLDFFPTTLTTLTTLPCFVIALITVIMFLHLLISYNIPQNLHFVNRFTLIYKDFNNIFIIASGLSKNAKYNLSISTLYLYCILYIILLFLIMHVSSTSFIS